MIKVRVCASMQITRAGFSCHVRELKDKLCGGSNKNYYEFTALIMTINTPILGYITSICVKSTVNMKSCEYLVLTKNVKLPIRTNYYSIMVQPEFTCAQR